MAKLNDAVVDGYIYSRVETITEDGRAIARDVKGLIKVEPKPNQWVVCGKYIKGWFGWKFVPNENIKEVK